MPNCIEAPFAQPLPNRATVVCLALSGCLFLGCDSPPPEQTVPAQAVPEAPAPAAPAPDRAALRVPKIETLTHFEASAFCEEYECRGPDTYSLRTGGNNTTYRTTLEETSVEAQTDGERVFGFGLSFNERESLSAPEFRAIDELLKAIDQGADATVARRHIQQHIEANVFQVNEAPPTRFSDYTLHAGKVGRTQVLSLARPRVASGNRQPTALSQRGNATSVLSSFQTTAGTVSIGDAWDDTLPKLDTGTRVDFRFVSPDRTEEMRRFGSDTYRLTYERNPGGPFRVISIVKTR